MEKRTGTQQSEAGMSRSYVVTGGGRGIGRAVVERLLDEAGTVVAIEFDQSALAWVDDHPAAPRVIAVVGDAADEKVAERAADLAQAAGTLTGWVNNAAIFRDASIHSAGARTVLDLVELNLNPAVVGCATAIRRQARQAVPGCTPYVTAKAAIEGLTRALAVEYGPHGIRVNAVAPGSVATERYEAFLGRQEPEAVARIEEEMRLLHPLGRVARFQEIAAAIVYLLSDDASFINGATVPVDGGRSVLAHDPEA